MTVLSRAAEELAAAKKRHDDEMARLKVAYSEAMQRRASEIAKLAEKVQALELPDELIAGILLELGDLKRAADGGDDKAKLRIKGLANAGKPFCPGQRGRKKADTNVEATAGTEAA